MTPDELIRCQQLIEKAGARFCGIQESRNGPLVLFHDPETRSTLCLYPHAMRTVDDVLSHMDKSRAGFFARSRE